MTRRAALPGTGPLRWPRAIGAIAAVATIAAMALAPGAALAQSAADYDRLLSATGYLESFQRTALVAERVFTARAQGSDLDFAKFMGIVARADLAPIRPCVADIYRAGDFTKAEIDRLVEIFLSPLGAKIREQSEQRIVKSYEAGSLQKPETSAFTASETQQMAAIYQEIAFQKFGRHSGNPANSRAVMNCMLKLDAVQRSGLEIPRS
jgi:hypothetical protein